MIDRVPAKGLDAQGIATAATLHWNLETAPLVELAIARGEGHLAADGPLVVATGKHTGRSAQDKFIVRDAETESSVWWGKTNKPMSPEGFAALKADFLAELARRDTLFVQDLYGGSQPAHRVNVRVVTQYAWHSLFIRTMLVRPPAHELADFEAEYTIIDLPGFRADPERHGCRSETVIAVNFSEKLILIGGTEYAGEMKKSVFGLLNYLLPVKGIMPMHCSANIGPEGGSAVFFGLSGTGKTTLSADASRTLIGDDEHGWSDEAVFNFEGGCYAKMIRLSAEAEPEIYATTKRFGTVLENVVMDPQTRVLDLDDNSLAEKVGVERIAHHRRAPLLGQVGVHHLGRRMHPGVGAAGGLEANRLAAEGVDRPFDRALHGRQAFLSLVAVVAAAVIFEDEAIARHQESFVPRGMANPRTKSAASCAPLPSRWALSRRTAPEPQAMVRASSSTMPGSPESPTGALSKAFTRTGPLSDGASNQAPGKGDRPRMWASTSAAGRVQSMRASAGLIFLA